MKLHTWARTLSASILLWICCTTRYASTTSCTTNRQRIEVEFGLWGYLCKSAAASLVELCRRPSQDSDKLYGLSRTLPARSRVDSDDDAEDTCCGDANGDAIGCMTVGDEVVLGSLRRVDSRLMNEVLCLNRWHDDDLPASSHALHLCHQPTRHLLTINKQ